MDKFWQVNAEAGTNGKRVTVLLYGDITMYPNWYQEDRSAFEIAEELKAQGPIEHISARINSPGGSAFGGLAIANVLRNWPAPVTTHVDGIAASAASMIFMAGDERVMPPNTLLFLHNPSTGLYGYSSDLRKAADELDTIREAMLSTYTEPSGLTDEQVIELLDGETFLTASKAKELGLATMIERMPVAASLSGERVVMNGFEFEPQRYHMTITDEIKALLAAGAQDIVPDSAADDTDGTADTAPADDQPDVAAAAIARTERAEEQARIIAAERERISAILTLGEEIPGAHELARAAAYESAMTPAEFALAAHQDPAVRNARRVQDRAADAAESGANDIIAAAPARIHEPAASGVRKTSAFAKYWPFGKNG